MSAAKVPLLGASVVCVVAAALSSCAGHVAGGGAPDSGAEGGGCGGAPPASAVRSVSLAMTQVNFGDDADPQAIGFDLDGKCTTATSTDVCKLVSGAPRDTQTDGVSGIDNGFGANICPILDTTGGAGACSTQITQAYVVTDAGGSGTLAIRLGVYWIEIPITDAYVTNRGGAGVLGAVMKPDDFLAALRNGAAASGVSLNAVCNPGGFDSIYFDVHQAADILGDGSNDAISIGMQFLDATTFTGALPDVPDVCGDSGPESGACSPAGTVCAHLGSCCLGLACTVRSNIPTCCYPTGQPCPGIGALCCDPGASCKGGTCCSDVGSCQFNEDCCSGQCVAYQCVAPDAGTDAGKDAGAEAGPADAGGE